MAAPATPDLMSTLVSLCKRRGFIFQSSEIYGGLNSCWDYGPLGVELKRNVKEAWWRAMVHGRRDIVGLDASILMSPEVWEASGHLAASPTRWSTAKAARRGSAPTTSPASTNAPTAAGSSPRCGNST